MYYSHILLRSSLLIYSSYAREIIAIGFFLDSPQHIFSRNELPIIFTYKIIKDIHDQSVVLSSVKVKWLQLEKNEGRTINFIYLEYKSSTIDRQMTPHTKQTK